MTSNSLSRITTFAITAAIGLALSVHAQADEISETRQANPDGRIQFQAVTGDFEVIGHDDDSFRLEGELGQDVEELIIEGSADSWNIKLEPVKSNSGWFKDMRSSELTLYVPRSAQVKASVVSGDLEVADLDGERVDAESVSGDVLLSNVRPQRLNAASVSGELTVEGGGQRETDLSTVSGDLIANEMFGRIQIQSVSGDIVIEGYDVSSFEAQSVSGDIEAVLEPLDRASIEINAHSGDIHLMLPAGTEMDFEASTFSGDIENEFGGRVEERTGPGEEMSFTEGSGSVEIETQTFSGDVYIERN